MTHIRIKKYDIKIRGNDLLSAPGRIGDIQRKNINNEIANDVRAVEEEVVDHGLLVGD